MNLWLYLFGHVILLCALPAVFAFLLRSQRLRWPITIATLITFLLVRSLLMLPAPIAAFTAAAFGFHSLRGIVRGAVTSKSSLSSLFLLATWSAIVLAELTLLASHYHSRNSISLNVTVLALIGLLTATAVSELSRRKLDIFLVSVALLCCTLLINSSWFVPNDYDSQALKNQIAPPLHCFLFAFIVSLIASYIVRRLTGTCKPGLFTAGRP